MGEDEAARVIQAGFKNALKRRNTGSSLDTVVPNGNGNTAAGEFVVRNYSFRVVFHHCTVVSERGGRKVILFLQIFSDHEM